ncbi:hypothetical protein R5M92_10260 [Halomonas sp. Bachu 37]|uniref:hypothetical protein n=1 Tax=Halomonas kashgarensis TaxID=3084920 RepID=UPI0032163508
MDGGAGGRPGGGVSTAAIGAAESVANGTPGNGNSGNPGGHGGGGGPGNANGYGGTFGDSLDAQSSSTTGGRVGSSMTGMNAMVSMDDAAKEAQAVFGGWATQADTQMGPENVGYGNSTYGGNNAMANASQAAAMTRGQHTQSLEVAGIPDSHHAAARPSIASRALSTVAAVANPALGLLGTAMNTHSAAKNAQESIGSINDAFGTSLDDSYGTAIGQQAKGTVAGTVGGKVGGTIGARAGMSVAGTPGAIAGGLLGAASMSNTARGAAMDGTNNSTGPGSPSDGGEPRGLLARATPRREPQSSRNGYVNINDYAYGNDRSPFDRYSDYAAQFFGTA